MNKLKCCELNCTKDAKFEIWYGMTTDDYTHSCQEHLNELTPEYDGISILELDENDEKEQIAKTRLGKT